MKKNLFLIICCLLTTKVFAQNRLSGKVSNNNNEPMPYVGVLLVHQADTTKREGALTSLSGDFAFKDVKRGKYLLKIAALGYKTVLKPIELAATDLNLGTFKMEEDALKLKEVNVTGQQANVKIKTDTIEYNATAFKTQPNAAVEELLKKLPGVEVDRDGNILVQGQKVSRLTVDGKDFFGTDPKTATKNLPADAVAKIQVIDSKTQEAKATGIGWPTRKSTESYH
jgi:hypothetical protein